MALELTAAQKKILNIFKIDEFYIIPEYQRPYSWEYDECFQLYNDLVDAFESKEDYFLGNIIIAKSENNDYELDVVDGQQRLTTIFLMMKVLSVFTKDELFIEDFEKILIGINRKTRKKEYRIKTEVFESSDKYDLEMVLKYTDEDFINIYETCINKKNSTFQVKKEFNNFQKNLLYFYEWFNFLKKRVFLDEFISYLLEKVFLLPIELRGKTKDIANEKALVIFETINNRGKNLEDADIFKAKLYNRAKKVNEEKEFIDLWKTFKNNCENLKIEIDEVFKYYSHIIRGEQGITSSEINLREFFTLKDYSPFNLKKYKNVMEDLDKIIEVLEFISQEIKQKSELSKWLQLIEAYTNQYPKLALVTYFFVNGFDNINNKNNLVLESIIRYVYYNGATTKVKFEIYSIIKKISQNELIDSYYYNNINSEYFNYLGNLKYGYALLAFYVERKESLDKYYIDKIINLKDKKILDWKEEEIEEYLNSLGNFIILDKPKKNTTLEKKILYYQECKDNDIKKEVSKLISLDKQVFIQREEDLKNKLVEFFRGN